MQKKLILTIFSLSALALIISSPALAAEQKVNKPNWNLRQIVSKRYNAIPMVSGTVTAINGNLISLTTKKGANYVADATNAKITKAGVALPVTNILVGDLLRVKGVLTGNNIAATNIMDGTKIKEEKENKGWLINKDNIYRGTITAINGATFSFDSKINGTSTIITANTSSSTVFKKDRKTASFSALAVGQKITVVGVKDSNNYITTTTNVGVMTVKKDFKKHVITKEYSQKNIEKNKQ